MDLRLPLGLQAVPGLAHRQNVARHGGVALELAPQIGDVRVERATHDARPVIPDFAEEVGARSGCSLATEQRREKLEFENVHLATRNYK